MVPVMLVLTVFTAAAMAIAVYLVVSAGVGVAAVAGAILLLSLSVLIITAVALVKLSGHQRSLLVHKDHIRKLSARSGEAFERLAALEARELDARPALDWVMAEVGELRRDVQDLRLAQKQAAPPPRAAPPGWQAAPRQAAHTPAAHAPAAVNEAAPQPSASDTLNLELEPVIDLAAGHTSHYRALLNLSGGDGPGVAHEQLIQKAEQGGVRPSLDVRLVRLVAPVLRRLRARNPGLRIFVPIGRTTLGAREEAGRLLAILQRDSDVASGMVFELSQPDLGRLEGLGLETLARLARSGAILALRVGSAEGLDLGALRQLGVRYLTVPPDAAALGRDLPPAAWNEFLRHAQALHIYLVAGSIKAPQQATAANKFARFGFGPFFAPPRRVRADAGTTATVAPNANVA
jgi:EAL domain-containing protein (putative c-di-GMP-specific phosphodiesterase class I)